MILLSDLKDMKVYNKKFMFPISDDKKKYNGNLIILNTENMEDSIKIINTKNIENKYTKCYYIDKTCMISINNSKKKQIINQNNYYKNVKSSCKNIIKTFPTLDKYEGLSVYYDFSVYNKLFNSNCNTSGKRKITQYKNFLNEIFDREEVNNYNSKYFICPIDDKNTYDYIKENIHGFIGNIINTITLQPEDILNFPDLEVIILSINSGSFFKFKLHSLKKTSLNLLKKNIELLIKLEKKEELTDSEKENIEIDEEEDEESIDSLDNKEVAKKIIKQEVKTNSSKCEEISMKIDEKIDNSKSSDLNEIEDDLNNDEEFLKYLDDLKNEKITAAISAKNTARNELLKEEQKKIKLNNSETVPTLDEVINEIKDKEITKETININNKNNEFLNQSTIRDFEKSYNENLDYKDKMTILNSLSDDNREIKVFIRDIKKEDTSTPFTKKETYTIELEDERRIRHKLKVDFPLMIEDKFMYIEGNKKILNKQLIFLPVVKIKPDEVQVISNSNKTFISRFGGKLSPKMEKFKKLLAESDVKNSYEYKFGDSNLINVNYITNIEYDELSKLYLFIKIGNVTIYFNQEEVRSIFEAKKIKLQDNPNIIPIGLNGTKPIFYNCTENILYDGSETPRTINLIDYIVELLEKKNKKVTEIYNNINVGKKYVYSRCSILSRKIPLLLFLAYNEGLSTVLHKAKINYELSDKRRILKGIEKEVTGCIPFKDKYLYYDAYPFKNSLLLNSFMNINTTEYEYELFDSKEIYLEIFYDLYGTRTIAKGFDNFYELFIDGITKEILEELNYPTEITELFLYANELLQDNQYVVETDMSNYRIRSNEMINAIFCKELDSAYVSYKNSINGATPGKISMSQDAIIKALTNNKYGDILQDYDTLNPIKESDSISTVSYKGPSGLTHHY